MILFMYTVQYLGIVEKAQDTQRSIGGPAEQEHRDHGQHLQQRREHCLDNVTDDAIA